MPAHGRFGLTLARTRPAGGVFSSASSSINGQKSVNLQFALPNGATGALRGESPPGGGPPKLVQLQVSAGGQLLDVAVVGIAGGGGGGGGSGAAGGGGVIDVDAIED